MASRDPRERGIQVILSTLETLRYTANLRKLLETTSFFDFEDLQHEIVLRYLLKDDEPYDLAKWAGKAFQNLIIDLLRKESTARKAEAALAHRYEKQQARRKAAKQARHHVLEALNASRIPDSRVRRALRDMLLKGKNKTEAAEEQGIHRNTIDRAVRELRRQSRDDGGP